MGRPKQPKCSRCGVEDKAVGQSLCKGCKAKQMAERKAGKPVVKKAVETTIELASGHEIYGTPGEGPVRGSPGSEAINAELAKFGTPEELEAAVLAPLMIGELPPRPEEEDEVVPEPAALTKREQGRRGKPEAKEPDSYGAHGPNCQCLYHRGLRR